MILEVSSNLNDVRILSLSRQDAPPKFKFSGEIICKIGVERDLKGSNPASHPQVPGARCSISCISGEINVKTFTLPAIVVGFVQSHLYSLRIWSDKSGETLGME